MTFHGDILGVHTLALEDKEQDGLVDQAYDVENDVDDDASNEAPSHQFSLLVISNPVSEAEQRVSCNENRELIDRLLKIQESSR